MPLLRQELFVTKSNLHELWHALRKLEGYRSLADTSEESTKPGVLLSTKTLYRKEAALISDKVKAHSVDYVCRVHACRRENDFRSVEELVADDVSLN